MGRPLPLPSALKKVTGEARFATDVVLPGMLHAALLHSPVSFARIVRLDVSPALRMQGVVAALTYQDVPKVRFGNFAFRHVEGVIEQETKRIQDLFILDDVAKFAGDEIAAVVAVDRQTAEEALEAIVVEYEPLQGVFDPEAAMRPDAPALHPEGNLIHPPEGVSPIYQQGSGDDPTFRFERGDVEAGLREADVVLERTYVVPFVNAASMEPRGCVADWDGENLSLWDSTQAPFKVRGEVARVLGLEREQIRVSAQFVGGGFGNKGIVHRYQVIAAMLTMNTGRPVRLAYSRKEEFVSGLQRYRGEFTTKVGATRDGRLTAISVRALANWGNNARGTVRPVFYGTTSPILLYRKCPNARFEAYVTYTNLPACGAYRGFGDPECQFGMESIMDELAERLDLDPLELRLINRVQSGDDLLPLFPGELMSSVGIDECIRRGAEQIGWGRRGQPNAGDGPVKRGLGFALSMHTGGHLVPATARVELSNNGDILVVSPLPDLGTEHQGAMRQIAAETLNMGVDHVEAEWADTRNTGDDFGIHGSRGVFMIGRCVEQAARQVQGQMRELAAETLGVPADELRTEDGHVVPLNGTGPSRQPRISFQDLASVAQRSGLRIHAEGRVGETNSVWGFGAHFAEVEVDTDSGDVRVLRLVAAGDVGRAINPTVVEAQLEGAAIQGLGYALTEELVHDPVIRGTTLNSNLLGYEVPTIREVPIVEPIIVESYEPIHPYGAKGCGEMGLVGVAPAIANAVYNALGIRFHEIPITPPKVLEALERQSKARNRNRAARLRPAKER